jgi:hypothetical protein
MSLPTIRADIAKSLVVLGLIVALLTTFVADANGGALHDVAHWASIALIVLSGVIAVLKEAESVLPASATPSKG